MAISKSRPAPNLVFSHIGLTVKSTAPMEKFYTEILGFTITDRGHADGMDIVFLSRDPNDHHQIVLVTGKPDNMPANTINPQFGPSVNQISFKMGTLADIRDMRDRLIEANCSNVFPVNHGIAWSVYVHDPEGNNLEFFVDTDWYIYQPLLLPLDFSKSDEEIVKDTQAMCEASAGFEPYSEWRKKISTRMTRFIPPPPKAPAASSMSSSVAH